MSISMIGIDHNMAPVDIRAKFAFTKKNAGEAMEKIKNQNKYFVKYFEEGMDMDATMPDGYTRGDISEVEDVVAGLEFLFSSVPDISELILEDDILEE